ADGDGTRLQALRHIAVKVDVEQAVLEVGALHLDVVGKLEATLEAARGDAVVQVLALLILRLLGAGDGERLLLHVDADLVLPEAGDRHGDAVLVLAQPLDVVGRVAGRALIEPGHRVDEFEQPVEADGGAIKGGKIDGSHDRCPPMEATCVICLPHGLSRSAEPLDGSGSLTCPDGPGSAWCAPATAACTKYI